MEMKIMHVLVAQQGFEVGDVVRVGVVPSIDRVNPDYAEYAGMFWASSGNGGIVYFPSDSLKTHVLEEVHASLEEILKQSIVYTDSGVQDSEDFFSSLKENEYEFNWDKSNEFDRRTKVEFFERHYCSDTWVGKGVLSIDGERVALFSQTGRKNPCDYSFFSKESKMKAKDFVKEFLNEDGYFFNDVMQPGENLVNFLA